MFILKSKQSFTLLFLIYLFFANTSLKSQVLSNIYGSNDMNSKSHSFEIFGNSEIGSTTLSTSVFKKYLNNSSLENNDKFFLGKNKKEIQRLGFESNYGFSFNYKPDSILKKNNTVLFNFNLEKKSVLSALFTNDILVNVFNGNTSFIGDTNGVNLSPTTIENYEFQKIGFGASFVLKNDSTSTILFARLSFVNAQKLNALTVSKSNIRFADSTYDISGNLDLNYEKSKLNNAYFATNGYGGTIDLGFKYFLSNANFSLQIKDVGLVKWKEAEVLNIDTAFNFKGYNIDMQRLINDTLYKLSVDSVFNIVNHKSNKTVYTFLPYTISLNAHTIWFKNKLASGVQFTFKRVAAFNPRILLTQLYIFNSRYKGGVFIANGGYTNFQYGLVFQTVFNKIDGSILIMNPHAVFINKALPIAALNFSIGYNW